MPHNDVKKKVEGVPVFSAQNLDIAIATKDGIKWWVMYHNIVLDESNLLVVFLVEVLTYSYSTRVNFIIFRFLVIFPPIRYTPYFFDKNTLDNILEESADQHFHALIETRHIQRRGGGGIDDILSAEAAEEMEESVWDPPEVQKLSRCGLLICYKILTAKQIINTKFS